MVFVMGDTSLAILLRLTMRSSDVYIRPEERRAIVLSGLAQKCQ